MRGVSLVLLGALVGAAVAVVAGALSTARPETGPGTPVAAQPGPARADQPAGAERLDRIERQLARLTAAVESLSAAPRGDAADAPRQPLSTTPDSATPLDGNQLADAMQQAEQRRLEGLADGELYAEARRLLRDERNPVAARRVLEVLLARPVSAELRVDALTRLGVAHRRTGDPAAAERAFRQALDLTGPDGDDGGWAAYEIAVTMQHRGDPASALPFAESAARAEGATDYVRMHGLWAVATSLHELGDLDRARAEYRAFLAAAKDAPDLQWLVRDVERRLKALH